MNGVVFVYGVEADFTWLDNDSLRSSASAVNNGAAITAASRGSSGVEWFGTLRGRLGYAMWENFLPFITGGLAYGEVDTKGRVTYSGQLLGQPFNNSFGFGDSDVEWGWTAGAGFDYLIRRSANGVGSGVVLNFTWLYVDLDDDHSAGNSFLATSQIGAQSALVSAATAENVDATFHVFRAGLSLKF
jgi:outer membrane immunogenic protein